MNRDAETLRKMAAYILEHGFDPRITVDDGCGCFLFAQRQVTGAGVTRRAFQAICDVTGASRSGFMSVGELTECGWTRGSTQDAAAACLIAAGLLEE